MKTNRIEILKAIAERRDSTVILYVTGDRPGAETQINQDAYDYFVNILDKTGVVHKISLILYTRGGNTIAAWSIVNLIRQFCDNFEVIVPHKAHSAGTLISIGAKSIIMTKQATLSPIDPSVITPLNPKIDGNRTFPISVEAVNGFLELAKANMGNTDANAIKDLIIQLSTKVHPIVLGEVHRSKAQIKMLSKKLISNTAINSEKINAIVSFLCSESGSHDYTIHRSEAKKLGLLIEKPNENFYTEIKALYDDFSQELKLSTKWDPQKESRLDSNITYNNKRCILESTNGQNYCYITKGLIKRIQQGTTVQINNNVIFEGWISED